MSGVTNVGDLGILKIVENSASLEIDQKAQGDYHAVLITNGQFKLTYTPNLSEGADPEAIPVKAYLKINNAEQNQYKGTNIYVPGTSEYIELQWGPMIDGTYYEATLSAADIAKLIQLGAEFELPTETDYQEFHALETKIGIEIYFEQIVTEP